MAITSKKINLGQLDKELGGKGLNGDFTDPAKKIVLPTELSDVTEDELKNAINNHVAIDESEANAKARQKILDRLGLTADEAALLLG